MRPSQSNVTGMRIYDSAFYAVIFFLSGVFISGLGLKFIANFLIVALIAVLFLVFGFAKKNKKLFWLSGLSLFIIVGSFYYFAYEAYQFQTAKIIFNKEISFRGVVVNAARQANSQKLTVELAKPFAGKISVQARPFPDFNYGDLVEFKGIIKNLPQSSAVSFLKDGILGTVQFPITTLISENKGNFIKASLLSFKGKIVNIFQKIMPEEQSAFLSGITLGERAEFSKEFKDQMSKSGTTHLVALSGYNISVLVMVIFGAFSYLFSRRICFWLTLSVIAGFVLMTGAEASVVRAAIMGGIILLAAQINRRYSFRNIIAVTAFVMVLINPKVLMFDVGFQLSFMALLGLVYFAPAFKNKFKIGNDAGFLSWKDNLLATLSAQVFVAPFLISYFGNFSFLSLLANILILCTIPLAMSLGFIAGAIGLFSVNMAVIFGWIVNLIVSYEIFAVKLFGNMDFLRINSISVPLIIAYYVFIVGFILYGEYYPAMFKHSKKS